MIESRLPYGCRILRPWENQDAYDRMMAWVDQNAEHGIDIKNASYGVSYINGKIYYAEVRFADPEDAVVFKLTFPEIT